MSSEKNERVKKLPPVDRVSGLYLGTDDYVRLQYKSADQACEIRFTIHEVLRMEEFFIMLRGDIGRQWPKASENIRPSY